MKFTGKDGSLRIYEFLGGFVEIHFSNMDFSASLGRPKREEQLILDRGLATKYGHYIIGTDMVLYDPVPISFSCIIEDVTGFNTTNGLKDIIFQALICRDARNDETDGTWTEWGHTTKGTSQVNGDFTPQFLQPLQYVKSGTVDGVSANLITDLSNTWEAGEASGLIVKVIGSGTGNGKSFILTDSIAPNDIAFQQSMGGVADIGDNLEYYENNRTVNVQFKLTGEANDIAWKFAEVYFPPSEITIAEAEDGITMSVTGGVYGAITRHSDWS